MLTEKAGWEEWIWFRQATQICLEGAAVAHGRLAVLPSEQLFSSNSCRVNPILRELACLLRVSCSMFTHADR